MKRTTDQDFYYQALTGNECQCGEAKHPWRAFCFPCYSRLPKELREELYNSKLGSGWEDVYERCVKFLNE